MKKGFKKFLGIAAVFSIFTGNAGIGASAYKFNTVSVASVPGMTDEEVKAMNITAELSLFFNEMASTDESQWDRNISEAQKLFIYLLSSIPLRNIEWKENYHKHENWRRVNPIVTKLMSNDFVVSHDKTVRMGEWLGKNVFQKILNLDS